MEADLVIIGGGPIGIACGVAARELGLRAVILEKGAVGETVRQFPNDMMFHSTSDLLGLKQFPLVTRGPRPSRQEMLRYLNVAVKFFELDLKSYAEVTHLRRTDAGFSVEVRDGRTWHAPRVIVATGYYDRPNLLNVPGEELSHVSHYYREPYGCGQSSVVIVGGGNSACEVALELYRFGASVTLVHRKPSFSDSIKYWIKPDLENRIEAGSIACHLESEVVRIEQGTMTIRSLRTGIEQELNADFVFLLTGYTPDVSLLIEAGVEVDPKTGVPAFQPETFETNVPGLFVAGSVIVGRRINRIFIENGYVHAEHIASAIRDCLSSVGA